jgi:hypothetical protein
MITWFCRVLSFLAVAVFYTGLPNYLHASHGLLVPYQWVLGFAALAVPIIIRHLRTIDILRSPVAAWCFLYLFVTIVWFIPSAQSDGAWQEVRWRVMTVLELGLFLVLLADPAMNKQVRMLLVVGVLFGVALNVYELFVPLSFSPIIGRSAGLYMNATTSAFALVGGMIFAVTVLPGSYRALFVLIVGVGVVTTFSRGGILAWCLATAGFVVVRQVGTREILRGFAVGGLLLGVLLFPQWEELLSSLDRAGVINTDVVERLLWLTDPSGVQDESSWSRAYVAKRLWGRWAEHPVLGSGTGSALNAFEIPPHNQYLLFMVDHGIVGILLFPLLIAAVIYRRGGERNLLGILFGCTQAFAALSSHTLLDEPQTLLLFALAATLPTAAVSRRSTQEVIAERRYHPHAAGLRAYGAR